MRVRYKTTHHNGIANCTCEEAKSPKKVMKIKLCEIRWHPNTEEMRKMWLVGNSNWVYFLNIPRWIVLLFLEYHVLKHNKT